MYYRTKYGKIIDENSQVIPMEDNNLLYQDYLVYLTNEGEIFESDYVFQDDLVDEALQIDLYYTGLISDLLRKHIEKLSIDLIPIPQDAIDERDRLRAECNQKILDLGITNFAYRRSNIKL
jgi:hypothetical protein